MSPGSGLCRQLPVFTCLTVLSWRGRKTKNRHSFTTSRPTTHHLVVRPGLVAAHPVAPHQLYGTVLVAGVQTVVVGHDLLALGVGEDLVAAQVMTISHAQVLPGLATHRVQTVLGLDVANLQFMGLNKVPCYREQLTSPR
jgi:hypothetical protein